MSPMTPGHWPLVEEGKPRSGAILPKQLSLVEISNYDVEREATLKRIRDSKGELMNKTPGCNFRLIVHHYLQLFFVMI